MLRATNLRRYAASSSILLTGVAALALVACGPGADPPPDFDPPAVDVWGVTATGSLVRFHIEDPATILETVPLSGLAAGDAIVALTNRGDYALGRQSRLYALDLATGALTEEEGMPFAPPLSGSCFDLDRNVILPGVLVVMEGGQRRDPEAAVAVPALPYAAGDVNEGNVADLVGFVGGLTIGYLVDASNDVLATLDIGFDVPDDDTLRTVGSLGVDIGCQAGLAYGEYYESEVPGAAKLPQTSIAPPSPVPALFLVATAAGETTSRLYLVDMQSGRADLFGAVGGGAPIVDVTFGARAAGALPSASRRRAMEER